MATVRVERDSQGCVVVAAGDIDMNVADQLEAALEEASGDLPSVIVDLTDATMLDSRAIGILLAWTGRLQRVDGGLAIAGASPDVRRLFATIGLEREFHFHATRDEARRG